jgi:putative tryptophan/tyrosine transport system substrate-binding protein
MLKGALIAATLLSLALPAASQDKVWRAGLLSGGTHAQLPGVHSTWRTGVLHGLEQNGFRIGKNLELVDRYAEGNLDRLPELSREIATNNVDVVVAIADPSVRAMLAATKVTPIVMVVGADPVEVGFVTSLARPGGRVTGVAFQIFEGDVKRLQLLREAMPQARRFGYLRPPGTIPARATEALADAARRLDIELITRVAARLEPAAYDAAFSAMRSEGASGVLVASTQQLSFDVCNGSLRSLSRWVCSLSVNGPTWLGPGVHWLMVTTWIMRTDALANTPPAFSRAPHRPIFRLSSWILGS